MSIKEFRFAWNGDVFSRSDTRILLGTFVAIVLTLLIVILAMVFEI